MPGFLSAYEGTETVDLGDGWWVKVKKCLSSTELGWAQSAMGADKQRVDGNSQYADLNVQAFQRELIVQSLDSWNLTDADDVLLPLDAGPVPVRHGQNPYPPNCPRRASVGRLPAPVFEQVYDKCNEQNGTRGTDEAARFPDEPVGGDPDGGDGTGSAPAVPEGEGAVAAARPHPRRRPLPAAPRDNGLPADH
jgi:hypothetical protein